MSKKIDLDPNVLEKLLNNIADAHNDFENSTRFSNFSKAEVDDYLYSLDSTIFIKYCVLTKHPQSYGSKFQERYRRKNGFKKIKSKLKSGDMLKVNGSKNIEYKVSIIDSENPMINIVQIRLHHKNIDYYVVEVYDARDIKKCKLLTTWYLSKEQMKEECNLHGNNSAHGDDGKAGFRIDFSFESDTFNRFQEKYQSNIL